MAELRLKASFNYSETNYLWLVIISSCNQNNVACIYASCCYPSKFWAETTMARLVRGPSHESGALAS